MTYINNKIPVGSKEIAFVDHLGNAIEVEVDSIGSEIHKNNEVFIVKIPKQTNSWELTGNSLTDPNINYLGTSDAQPLVIRTSNIERVRVLSNGDIGIGTNTPTSTLQINGSVSESISVITSTTVLNSAHNKLIINNAATNITLTLPDALTCIGRKYELSRYNGSTGKITLAATGTNLVQALAGTVGATTSISLHSTAGAGLSISFTAANVGGIGVWVRL